MTRLLTGLLVGLVLLATLPGVTAGGTRDPGGSGGPAVGVDVRITSHNDSTIAYRYTFDVPASVEGFRVRLYTGRVADSHGFRFVHRPRLLTWNGSDRATITAYQRVGASGSTDCPCSVTPRWIVAEPIRVDLAVERGNHTRRVQLTDWFGGPTTDTSVDVDGQFTPGVVYVGPTEVAETNRSGQHLRVLGPSGPAQLDADRVLTTLERGADLVDLTPGANRSVTMTIMPRSNRTLEVDGANGLDARGVTLSHGYAFVAGGTGPSTWLHEYVHTQERYTTDKSMQWFTEATASYYGDVLAARVQGRPASQVVASFRDDPGPDGVLSKPPTWASMYVPYERGARTIAYLDWRIRQATGGNRTFRSVYRRLNRDRTLQLTDFQDAVAAVVGDRSLDPAITRYVTTNATLGRAWGPASSSDSTPSKTVAAARSLARSPKTVETARRRVSSSPTTVRTTSVDTPESPHRRTGGATRLTLLGMFAAALGAVALGGLRLFG